MKRQRALITGGAGFIGSHLCDHLLAKGFSVICLDNLITGSKENIRHNLKNKDFKFIKHDISKPINISGKIDCVLHFASPASPRDYEEFPIQTLKVGALGTHNALGIAKKKRARFVLASTSEVYGDPAVSPQSESYWGNVNPVGPRSCYDEAKRFAEAITMAYFRKHGLDVRIVRIFNTYGPRMRKNDGRVIPNFIGQALKKKPFTVYGNGKQTRSFCYVSDLIDGVYELMSLDKIKKHRIFNLGNPNEISMLKLIDILRKVSDADSKIVFLPLPQDDPKRRRPDIRLAKNILGWEPRVDLFDGLSATINWRRIQLEDDAPE